MGLDRVSLKTISQTVFADNTTGDITPQDLRDFIDKLLDAVLVAQDDSDLLTCDVIISSAELLTYGGAGIVLLPAAGAGIAYQIIGQVAMKYTYGTIAYATNTNAKYTISGLESSNTSLLSGAVNRFAFLNNFEGSSNATSFENVPVLFKVDGGNPTAGDGIVRVVFKYRLLQL